MTTSRHVGAFTIGLAVVVAGCAVAAQSGYRPGNAQRLSGTYQLDRGKSDRPQQVANDVTRSLGSDLRDRVAQDLMDRLESPDMIAIDLNGRTVSITSSNAPRLTFDADGRDRNESGPGGRQIVTHADVYGNELTVSTSGNRGSDFTVRFEPTRDGLNVTRQVDSPDLRTPVTVESTYRRVSDQPRWNVYGEGGGGIIPEGTGLTARLDRDLSIRNVREGARFTMTVVEGAYRGAVINGFVASANQRSGRTDMVVDFDRVRLNNGRSGSFEGEIEAIRTPDGRTIRVDRSGVVRNRSRDDSSTVQSGAVGATLGAIIGAIAGGGKGAAIGAVAGGAGMILIEEGRDDVNLRAGTVFTISAFSPRYTPGR
jgi:hypothetical protein